MHTNLRAPYLMMRSLAPIDDCGRSGHIINISSLAGKNILPEGAAYAASKWGLNGLTYSVAEELRQYNVRVSVIAPGSVNTHFGGCAAAQGSNPNDPARRRRPGGGHAGDPGSDLLCQRSSPPPYHEALREEAPRESPEGTAESSPCMKSWESAILSKRSSPAGTTETHRPGVQGEKSPQLVREAGACVLVNPGESWIAALPSKTPLWTRQHP